MSNNYDPHNTADRRPSNGYNSHQQPPYTDPSYTDSQNNTAPRQYLRNPNTDSAGRGMPQSASATFRGQNGRPLSVQSFGAYTSGDVGVGNNMGNRTRSLHSVGTNKSAVSVASIKSEIYHDHQNKMRHEKLNRTNMGGGVRMYKFAIIVAVIASLFLAAGLACIILQFTQRIVIQDQMEFIGPCLIAISVVGYGAAVYLYYQARRRSSQTRKNIRFQASGLHEVSAVNLAYEPERRDLVSGKHTPGTRTPVGVSGAATPKVIGGGYVTPGGTVQRGNVFTYGVSGDGNKTPTTPASYLSPPPTGAISVGMSGGTAARRGQPMGPGGGGAYVHGSAASRAQQKKAAAQYPSDMPSFAAPVYDEELGRDGMPIAPPLQMDYAPDIPNLPPGDPMDSTLDTTLDTSAYNKPGGLYGPPPGARNDNYQGGAYGGQPIQGSYTGGASYAPPPSHTPAAYAPSQGPTYAPPSQNDSGTEQKRFRKREGRGARAAAVSGGAQVTQDSKESEL